jgi:hypothetical protein
MIVSAEGIEPDTVAVTMRVYTDVGIDEVSNLLSHVHLYPNPVLNSTFHVELTAKEKGMLQLDVLDLSGRLLHSQKASLRVGYNLFKVTNLDLAKGAYLYSLSYEGVTFKTGKLIRN